jgi:hypothetical protein
MATHIPIQDPQLSSTVYEMVLAWLLQHDHKVKYIVFCCLPFTRQTDPSHVVTVRHAA